VTVVDYFDKLVPPSVEALLVPILADLTVLFGDYGAEMKGMANATGIELGKVRRGIMMMRMMID